LTYVLNEKYGGIEILFRIEFRKENDVALHVLG